MTVLTHLLDLPGLRVDHVAIERDTVIVTASPSATAAICPTCATASTRVHSAYTRSLHDLPWGTRVLHLTLTLRRFRCRAPACPRQTFVERIPHIAPPYARSTLRVRDRRQSVGLALGGEAGARLAACLRIATSPDTLLRLIRAAPLPPTPPPRIIGIDDWAYRRGQRYGTIVIDLETHRPIELLPDRSATVVAAWLFMQPTIECISRDRADAYIVGATQGAPNARQVADRWHLIKNLGDALQRMLERHGAALRAAARHMADDGVPLILPPQPEVVAIPSVVPRPPAPAHRRQQFAEVKRLHQAGWSLRRISHTLQLHRRTVRKYVQAETVPVRILPQNISHAAAYLPTIASLWQAGCRTYQDLWIELQKVGFRGSYSSVRRLMKQFDPTDRRLDPQVPRPPIGPPLRSYSARQAMWLLVRRTDELEAEEAQYREHLCACCPAAAIGRGLAQRFLRLVCEREAETLDAWLSDAEQCGVAEVRNFAVHLRRDYAAVLGALQEPWSNGPVEAHIHRLKLIKRTMYGRAKFDLLRKRVLAQI